MGRYTSQELYHFVGRMHPDDDEANYQLLRKILADGCVSHPPHEANWGTTGYTIRWDQSLLSQGLIVPTVVCFCDIPEEHHQIHRRNYGRFGLSFPRDFLVRHGARPVTYIPLHTKGWLLSAFGGHEILKDMEQVYRGFRSHIHDKLTEPRTDGRGIGGRVTTYNQAVYRLDYLLVMYLLAFIKPFNSLLQEDHHDNFYMEREWRKFGNQKFMPSDVGTIMVARRFETRLAAEMPIYSKKIAVAAER